MKRTQLSKSSDDSEHGLVGTETKGIDESIELYQISQEHSVPVSLIYIKRDELGTVNYYVITEDVKQIILGDIFDTPTTTFAQLLSENNKEKVILSLENYYLFPPFAGATDISYKRPVNLPSYVYSFIISQTIFTQIKQRLIDLIVLTDTERDEVTKLLKDFEVVSVEDEARYANVNYDDARSLVLGKTNKLVSGKIRDFYSVLVERSTAFIMELLLELADRINYVKESNEFMTYATAADLRNSNASTATEIRRQLDYQKELLRLALIKEQKLIDGTRNAYSKNYEEDTHLLGDVEVTGAQYIYETHYNNTKVTPEDGFDIFDKAITSPLLPFVRYVDADGVSYNSIYTGGKNEVPIDRTVIPFIKQKKTPPVNQITFILWDVEETEASDTKIVVATKESFLEFTLQLDTGIMSANMLKKEGTSEEPVLRERITSLTGLTFASARRNTIRTTFNIYNSFVDESVFFHFVMNDDLLSSYMVSDEHTTSFPERKRFIVNVRELLPGSDGNKKPNKLSFLSFKNDSLLQRDVFDEFYVKRAKMIPAGTAIFKVTTSEVVDEEYVRNISRRMRTYLKYFDLSKGITYDLYETNFPELLFLPARLNSGKRQGSRLIKGYDTDLFADVETEDNWRFNRLKEADDERLRLDKLDGVGILGDPGAFIKQQYTKMCSEARQPTPIAQDEQPRVGEDEMLFPLRRTNHPLKLVCRATKYKHIGVSINHNEANNDIYPYCPCCFEKQQVGKAKGNYYDYSMRDEVGISIGDKPIKTEVLLDPGKRGYIPKAVNEILKFAVRVTDPGALFLHMGVIRDTNSLLHCVLYATRQKYRDMLENYLLIGNTPKEFSTAQIKLYVENRRIKMAKATKPALLRQEMYDYTDEQIKNYIEDNSKPLDPQLVYRMLEEYFNINIFVFSVEELSEKTNKSKKRKKAIIQGITLGIIEIPRHKYFHTRIPRRDRKSILVFKHKGQGLLPLRYPQCDLIISETDVTKELEAPKLSKKGLEIKEREEKRKLVSLIFEEKITDICTEILERASTVTLIGTGNINESVDYTKVIPDSERNNLYADSALISRAKIVNQYIDDAGKTRAIQYERGDVLFIPPTQPYNVTNTLSIDIHNDRDVNIPGYVPYSVSVISVSETEESELIKETTRSKIRRSKLAEVTTTTRKIEKVDGIWVTNGNQLRNIYIPIVYRNYEGEQRGEPNPLYNPVELSTKIVRRSIRNINIIKQILVWLFEMYRHQIALTSRGVKLEGRNLVNKFLEEYSEITNTKESYDLSGIPRYFANVRQGTRYQISNIADGMDFLEDHAESLVQRGVLLFYSNEFADKARSYLISYDNLVSEREIPKFIQGYYNNSTDFTPKQNTHILVTDSDLQLWLSSIREERDKSEIYKVYLTVTTDTKNYKKPYIVKIGDTQHYIIQNSAPSDTLKASYHLVRVWKETGKNLGYVEHSIITEEDEDLRTQRNRKVYVLDRYSRIVPSEHYSAVENDNPIEILYNGLESEIDAFQEGRVPELRNRYSALFKTA